MMKIPYRCEKLKAQERPVHHKSLSAFPPVLMARQLKVCSLTPKARIVPTVKLNIRASEHNVVYLSSSAVCRRLAF
ncbi:unnamed protein product [Leptosia nina]|uniref:Uncharacterized protein n=1 Tax=Leptosia nina TaxID=320188 RepID=A0AAV1J6C8_9NEOP